MNEPTRTSLPHSDDYGDPDYDAMCDAVERGLWPARQYTREGEE